MTLGGTGDRCRVTRGTSSGGAIFLKLGCEGRRVRRVEELDDEHARDAAAYLREDEDRGGRRGDAGERVGEHAADGDRGVREAGGGGEPVGGADVGAD